MCVTGMELADRYTRAGNSAGVPMTKKPPLLCREPLLSKTSLTLLVRISPCLTSMSFHSCGLGEAPRLDKSVPEQLTFKKWHQPSGPGYLLYM